MNSLRVLFVSSLEHAPWGAAEELWSQAALSAAAAGHHVTASVREWPEPVPRHQDLRAGGVSVELRSGGLGAAIEKGGWHLVVVNQPDVFSGAPWTSWCAARAIPYVVIVHYSAAHSWRADAIALEAGRALAGARACLFISDATRRAAEVQTGHPLPQAEIVLAPYRVPYEGELPWPAEGALRLALVARVDAEDKGHDVLIETLAEPRWRDRAVLLDIVGRGPHEEVLRRLVDRLGLASRVRFRGHIEDIASVWRNAHVAVMPSRAEGLPAALVEAMLCGRPAVVTDVGGMATLVQEGVTGYLASAATRGQFSAAMERLWAGRNHMDSLGRQAACHARRLTAPFPAGLLVRRLERIAGGGAATAGTSAWEEEAT
ncbi:MAG: glycosyltransferase family 4 protein [Streptosporangiaceae bacterium]